MGIREMYTQWGSKFPSNVIFKTKGFRCIRGGRGPIKILGLEKTINIKFVNCKIKFLMIFARLYEHMDAKFY